MDLINGQIAGRSHALDETAVWWARDGIFLLIAIAGPFGLWELRRSPRRALVAATIVTLGAAFAGGLLLVASGAIHEARPFVTDHDTVLLLKHSADNSFPSDHATLAGVIAMAAALTWKRWAALFITLGLLVGLARVVAGVHYPGDVAAGWSIGAGCVALAWLAVTRSGFVNPRPEPER